jgi:hypothetical protein
MSKRILVLLASVSLLLTGCAQASPAVDELPTAAPTQSASGSDATDIPTVSPTVEPVVKDDYYNFLNSMATTCLYAQGVGVTETVSTNGVLDGSLILLPPSAAISDGYTAGWIPANGEPAEVIFESDAFGACALANMEALAKEAGGDLRKSVKVKYDAETNSYTATVDFSGFASTSKYQIGEGGIVYSVKGTDSNGAEVLTSMKFGIPKSEYIEALRGAVEKLFLD